MCPFRTIPLIRVFRVPNPAPAPIPIGWADAGARLLDAEHHGLRSHAGAWERDTDVIDALYLVGAVDAVADGLDGVGGGVPLIEAQEIAHVDYGNSVRSFSHTSVTTLPGSCPMFSA